MKVKRHEETVCRIRLKRAMKKGKKILGFLIPVLIVIAGICVVYFFTFSDAYLKIPAKTDLSGSKYVGNWTELGSDGSSGAALDLAENGRALIKLNGRTESVGTWSETESGVVFKPLVESSKFSIETFESQKWLSDRSPESLGYAGDCFLINNQVAFAQLSDELVYDMEARDEAIQEIRNNYEILTSEDSWDFSRVDDLKEQWLEFWAGFKELIHSF